MLKILLFAPNFSYKGAFPALSLKGKNFFLKLRDIVFLLLPPPLFLLQRHG